MSFDEKLYTKCLNFSTGFWKTISSSKRYSFLYRITSPFAFSSSQGSNFFNNTSRSIRLIVPVLQNIFIVHAKTGTTKSNFIIDLNKSKKNEKVSRIEFDDTSGEPFVPLTTINSSGYYGKDGALTTESKLEYFEKNRREILILFSKGSDYNKKSTLCIYRFRFNEETNVLEITYPCISKLFIDRHIFRNAIEYKRKKMVILSDMHYGVLTFVKFCVDQKPVNNTDDENIKVPNVINSIRLQKQSNSRFKEFEYIKEYDLYILLFTQESSYSTRPSYRFQVFILKILDRNILLYSPRSFRNLQMRNIKACIHEKYLILLRLKMRKYDYRRKNEEDKFETIDLYQLVENNNNNNEMEKYEYIKLKSYTVRHPSEKINNKYKMVMDPKFGYLGTSKSIFCLNDITNTIDIFSIKGKFLNSIQLVHSNPYYEKEKDLRRFQWFHKKQGFMASNYSGEIHIVFIKDKKKYHKTQLRFYSGDTKERIQFIRDEHLDFFDNEDEDEEEGEEGGVRNSKKRICMRNVEICIECSFLV